jgi:hypothetical protein
VAREKCILIVRIVGASALKGGEYQSRWLARQCFVTGNDVAVLAHGLLGN